MLDALFGRDNGHEMLESMRFDALEPFTHVTAKMDHRKGLEKTCWHHGVYCGTGRYIKFLAEAMGIDMKPYHVPVGTKRVTLTQYLEENSERHLICEYEGPRANGQLGAPGPSFKGRVTFNHTETWQVLYRKVCHVVHTKRKQPDDKILRSVFDSLGREGYSVLFSNCEHHTTGCLTGNEQSKQATGGLTLAGIGLGVVAAIAGLAAYAVVRKEDDRATLARHSEQFSENETRKRSGTDEPRVSPRDRAGSNSSAEIEAVVKVARQGDILET